MASTKLKMEGPDSPSYAQIVVFTLNQETIYHETHGGFIGLLSPPMVGAWELDVVLYKEYIFIIYFHNTFCFSIRIHVYKNINIQILATY